MSRLSDCTESALVTARQARARGAIVVGMLATMDDDTLGSLAKHFAMRADRPFGDIELVSGRTLQPFSIAGQQAATNLLDKASRALSNGDPDRARAFVDRATQLPFDEHEQALPVTIAVHMDLFGLVTDTLENSSADDSRWLDAAIDVLSTADEAGRCEMRDVLVAIDHDYQLERRERRSIRSAIAPIPDRPELRDQQLETPELRDCVMSILAVCRDYRAALEASAN